MEATQKLNMSENELLYPISMKYGHKDWDVVAALREFFTNMLDTQAPYHHEYKNGYAVLSDKGTGLTKKDFIFGESCRDDSQIGQFGEGLKMALLTLLRNNRAVKIETVGFDVTVEKVWSKVYDSEVMLLKFAENKRQTGTTVTVACTKPEYQQAVALFLHLKDDLTRLEKDLYLPAGDVYVLGLKTTTLSKALYSYNLKDKRMVNRDRNIVETNRLQSNIVHALEAMKTQRAIRVYLENIEKRPTAFEYQLALSPHHLNVWKKTLRKIYQDKVARSSDLQSDMHATAMGYKVFRNVPYHVNNVLQLLDIPTSAEIARNYQGEGLFEKDKIVYPMHIGYCKDWTPVQAIREFIGNALDTSSDIRVTYSNGRGRIVDNGRGILKKHFIFGLSDKGDSQIGQFGEGLKVASLVMARNQREVTIETIGYTYKAEVEHRAEFDASLFTVYFKRNQRKSGTVISFNCTEEELEEAKNLFLYFQKKKPTLASEKLDIFLDEAGAVYVNGLKTTQLESLFSYNFKDKTLVSTRDRNAVDIIKLSDYLQEQFATMANTEIMETLLSSWQQTRTAFEYRIDFVPRNIEPWKKLAKKIFKKACIASLDYEHNFIAKQAGYTILHNPPSVIGELLFRCQIPNAEKIAKRYKNKGIVLDHRIVYPITAQYGASWTVADGIREILANALDTGTKVSIRQENGVVTISDNGEGLSKRNLLFGDSTKQNTSQIGQFGEGLKMASLVLARNNRQFRLVTKGFEYEAKIEKDKEFNADVLVLYLKKSRKRKGTDISFKCSKKELNEVKELFLAYNTKFKEVAEGIYEPGGVIFVNGVQISKTSSLFSYNLTNAKKCLSRDRKSLQIDVANKEIEYIIGKCDNQAFLETLFTKLNHNHLESHLMFIPLNAVRPVWQSVMKKLYPKHCFPIHNEYDLAATDRGYKLLPNLPRPLQEVFALLGMPYSHQVATLKGDESIVKSRGSEKDLSKEGKARWRKALRKMKKLYGEEVSKKCKIVREFNLDNVSMGTIGYYNEANDTVYILKELVEHGSFAHLLGTLIHEHIHRTSGAPDRTREFENALSHELGRIAEEYV